MPSRIRVLRYLLVIAVAAPCFAHAGGNVAGLLCSKLNEQAWNTFLTFVRNVGVETGDGVIKFKGPIREADACVRNVVLAASFGVILATGESCSADGSAFVQGIGALLNAKPASGSAPNVLAKFELANGSRAPGILSVYRGQPSLGEPLPSNSSTISYTCARSEGGTQ